MATYYIESDGAGGTTGGDGSSGSPYGTMAEMISDIGSLSDGDVVYFDTDTNGPLLESWSASNLDGVTFGPWSGRTTTVRILNAALATVDTVHDIGGGDPFDTYKNAISDLGAAPETVVEDWDTRVNSDGNRYGFLPEVGTLAGLRTTRGWLWNGSRLFVSVPDGEDASTKTYYAGLSGDVWTLTNPSNVTINNFSFELATESGNGNGYGLRLLGDVSNVTLNNYEFDGCQYHSFGSVGNSTTGLEMTGGVFRTVAAGTDSHWVVYSSSSSVGTSGVVVDGVIFWLVPWLKYDGTPLETSGGVKAVAAHHLTGAAATQTGGILFKNYESKYNGDNASSASLDFVFTAPNTNHASPSDETDPADYPIIVQDSICRGHGIGAGGGSSAEVHIAFDRCQLDLDTSSVTSGQPVGGSQIAATAGSGSSTTVLMRACTVSATLADAISNGVFAVWIGGARLLTENCTVLLNGTYANNVCFYNTNSAAGFLSMRGNIFQNDGDSIQLLRGALDRANNLEAEANWYSEDLNATFSANGTVSRASWESTYDPDGKYDGSPTFADADTLEPSSGSIIKNASKATGPVGINGNPYDTTYGAWQYGSSSTGGNRSRIRDGLRQR